MCAWQREKGREKSAKIVSNFSKNRFNLKNVKFEKYEDIGFVKKKTFNKKSVTKNFLKHFFWSCQKCSKKHERSNMEHSNMERSNMERIKCNANTDKYFVYLHIFFL